MGAVWDFVLSLTSNLGAGICLLICGVVWILDTAFEASRREGLFKRDDNWDFDVTTLLKIITIIGCASGLIFTMVGIMGYMAHTITKTLTCTSLIILGILTLLKPVNDLPIATGLAVLSTIVVAIIIVAIVYFSPLELVISWQTGLILVIVLVVVFIICLGIAKFWLAGPQLVSKIVSIPVVSVIGAVYCFILGGLVLAGIYV